MCVQPEALDNTGDNVGAALLRAWRREVDRLQRHREKLLGPRGAGFCGHPINSAAGVTMRRHPDGRRSYVGLQSCGRSDCPRCGPRSANLWAESLGEAFGEHVKAGGCLLHAVLTVPHAAPDGWELARVVAATWRAFTQLTHWRRRHRVGVAHFAKAVETVHGWNGAHPHIHLALLVEPNADPTAVQAWAEGMLVGWVAAVARAGLGRASLEAQHLSDITRPAAAARYLTKVRATAATEMARGDLKAGAGRSLQALLRDSADGDVWAGKLFAASSEPLRKLRRMTVSRGLWERYGVDPPNDPATNADLRPDEVAEVRMSLPLFRRLRRDGLAVAVLETAEACGVGAAAEFVRRRGVPLLERRAPCGPLGLMTWDLPPPTGPPAW